ncbi:hypothetical protein ACIP5Y_21205 [Nocardia sp. NPDC088792]|uniref:hypothetical protein n=1 Tax=Nocardia sp. NPDC088792 TaxID=3364332 RepID=UPI00380E218F
MTDREGDWSNPREAVEVGRRILANRGIDISAAKLAFKSNHPQVTDEWIEPAIALQVASFSRWLPPYTVGSVAEQLANTEGAFPWDGPIGNGLTVNEYQSKFRDMARDQLFLMHQLGMIEDRDA